MTGKPPHAAIRVIVADDHTMLRDGLRRVLGDQEDMALVAEAENLERLLACLAETPADVVLLDLSMPGAGGAELLAAVRGAAPGVRVVILTMYPEDQLALHLLGQGASAYLSKTRTPREILTAIRRAAAGEPYLTDTLAEMTGLDGPRESTRLPHERLSVREYQVFILTLQGRTPTEIAAELEVGQSTVSTYLAGVRQKLGVTTSLEIVLYGHRVGLLS